MTEVIRKPPLVVCSVCGVFSRFSDHIDRPCFMRYRRVQEQSSDLALGVDPAGREQELIELRVEQDMLRSRGLGHWRLLMAVRVADGDDDGRDEFGATRVALNDGLSAGLSVSF